MGAVSGCLVTCSGRLVTYNAAAAARAEAGGAKRSWRERAAEVMDAWDLSALSTRTFGTLSDGERKRVQIARAVMTDPELMLLDEPAGSLDLGARESLLQSLEDYASSSLAPAIVMVTHHVEEIPPGFTHGMLLRDGAIVAAGPLDEVLTDARLTETFGLPLEVRHENGRWSARAPR